VQGNLAVLANRMEATTKDLAELAAMADRLAQPDCPGSRNAQEAARTLAPHLNRSFKQLNSPFLRTLQGRLFH
jgi:hypothetical protein